MGVLAILGMVSQAVALAAGTARSVTQLYGVVGDVFKDMAADGRDEPTQEEINRVRAVYDAMRTDFHEDDERNPPV